MQVTETKSEGLKREFQVVLAAAELEDRLTTELAGMKDKVQLKGFRPGKVPVAHLRRVYGRSIMADVVQNAVNEANQKILEENKLKLALEPQIKMPEDKAEIEKALDAKADLAFQVALEVMPTFELQDHSDITVTKPVATVSDEEVETALKRMAEQSRSYADRPEGSAAETGDRVVIDFVGRIGGETFEGGSAEDADLDLGSNTFIPGFEDQLLGAKAGEARTVTVTFPEGYPAEHLAGKEAVFDVTVKAVKAPGEAQIDDELAKTFGLENLDALKDAVRKSLANELDAQSRRRVKKALLDALDARYAFDLPPTLVHQEFAAVWAQVEADLKSRGKTFEDEGTTEEKAQGEYRRIAERRVRLGLVLAQVGETADIKVPDEEVNQALIARLRQFPGQEREVYDFYRKNPQAMAELRAPLFEEKVVDHVLGQVKLVEEPVSKEALFADDEDEAAEAAAPASEAGASKGVISEGVISEGSAPSHETGAA
ncbi:trigger factor [Methylobacterium sp. 4-46]|uniref:Trigger factor n=1 Tax=Methylobacterium sp. (strain 4-46) TaxID=426117 RepID=TIG_METS4|nr:MULTISPECIES: trigger factor [Methylobacterium]B0UD17.1 RecName: Full=Trigger factor; Short=TF; AltName: Full=PPIase [Methylobacterium sp. 4-46]ACA20838.1 trigger factor [Methylobacterium sp. 4-46]WFT79993.1 trigger factor [Methylobacterium nodulans]